jgi:hypothetical protein
MLNGVISRGPSVLRWLHAHGYLSPGTKLSAEPGEPLSWNLGWMGFGLICLTNIYVFKKKKAVQSQKSNLRQSLDRHIFLGLLGPTLIVFHCNFKVRGLVAISFWSMVVCFISGIVGRYFYVQLLKDRAGLKSVLDNYEKAFTKVLNSQSTQLSKEDLEDAKSLAFVYAGGSRAMLLGRLSISQVLLKSIIGDFKLFFARPPVSPLLPRALKVPLAEYALVLRRFYAGKYFRRLMGYWHAFHKPFAVFMYVVTVIHIAAALIFRVKTP